MRRNLLILVFVAALWWWLTTGDVPVVELARDVLTRGRRLSRSTMIDGTVAESLAELVAQATQVRGSYVSSDAYILARIADSEHPTASAREKAAIMQVCRNDAAAHGWSLHYTATVGKGFGRQAGRRYSTAHDPYEATLELADQVLAGAVADETEGATKFVHVTGFGSIAAYASLALSWYKQHGLVPFVLDGIRSFRLFIPERVANERNLPIDERIASAIAAERDGNA